MDYPTPTPLASAGNLDRPGAADTSLDVAGAPTLTPPGDFEEDLVADARASLTPAQMVERKLAFLLKSNPLPVSLMTGGRTIRGR
jgi:hypothetical protein